MTDFDKSHVTIAVTPFDMAPLSRSEHREKIMRRHPVNADEVTVLVPPGTGREAMVAIWKALGSEPKAQRHDNPIDQFCDRLGLEP